MTLRVQIVFEGEPFNRDAAIHTLRHLAMRVGWELTLGSRADKRIVYATTDDPNAVNARPDDVVILSSRQIAEHLEQSREPIPVTRLPDGKMLPFPHRAPDSRWISADVVAGAFAVMNLWYEERTRSDKRDGWVTWHEDWMGRVGLHEPTPLADEWLGEIAQAAKRLGWAATTAAGDFTVVLTHDVDYLPGARDRGLPRVLRAALRQIVLRRRVRDAFAVLGHYARTHQPDLPFDAVMGAEESRRARSSFQVVPSRRSRFDPGYAIEDERIASALRKIGASDWEICLHGSYAASRTPGGLELERAKLERAVGAPVRGHRQHYLNFHPSQLFDEVDRAGLDYDMSVGYNDASGARAGTFFPYHPFSLAHNHAHKFWEIPFVLMDTTLATTYRLSPPQAAQHSQAVLANVARARGSVSIIWHLEQLSGLVDPGFDQVYYDLLDWIRAQGGVMTTARNILPEWDARWRATMLDD